VTRYNTDGGLDTSFGSGGETRVDIPDGPHHDGNKGVVIRSDDTIVTTAQEYYGSWGGLQHYTSTGSFSSRTYLSSGYGGGIAVDSDDNVVAHTQYALTGPFGSGDTSHTPFVSNAQGLILDSSDRVLVLSHATDAFKVVRLLTDGSLDSSFGAGGLSELRPGYSTFQAKAIQLQSDGKIVVGGVIDSGGGNDFVVARICP
jgi:uncharacterized delta-60 repeat protein